MRYALDRLKERSTWNGLVALATIIGWGITPEQGEAVAGAGVAIGSLLNIFWKG